MNSYSPGISWFNEETGEREWGTMVNTAFCNVTGTWNMLVVTEGGVFRSLNPTSFGVEAVTMIYSDDGEDEADDEV